MNLHAIQPPDLETLRVSYQNRWPTSYVFEIAIHPQTLEHAIRYRHPSGGLWDYLTDESNANQREWMHNHHPEDRE